MLGGWLTGHSTPHLSPRLPLWRPGLNPNTLFLNLINQALDQGIVLWGNIKMMLRVHYMTSFWYCWSSGSCEMPKINCTQLAGGVTTLAVETMIWQQVGEEAGLIYRRRWWADGRQVCKMRRAESPESDEGRPCPHCKHPQRDRAGDTRKGET